MPTEVVAVYGRNHYQSDHKNKFHYVVSFFEWIVYIESESIVRLGKRRTEHQCQIYSHFIIVKTF